MTKEERTLYHKEWREKPGVQQRLNDYYRMYYRLNQEEIQRYRSNYYFKQKIKRLKND